SHIDQLNYRPFPTFGFPVNHRQGAHTHHSKYIENQKRGRSGEVKAWATCFRVNFFSHTGFNCVFIFHSTYTINGAHSAYKHLAGSERGNESNSDLPVIPQRLNSRLNGLSKNSCIGF